MRWLFVVAVLVGCTDSSSDPIEPQVTSGTMQLQIPMSVNRKIDMLFVIDNSPAMAPYLDNVRANLGRVVATLRSLRGGFPDLRLGVVTTDVIADDGKLRGTTGLTGNFVVDFVGPDGNRMRNYDGDLEGVFARLTDVTTGGTAEPLVAAHRAFERNRSFLRPEAYTAIYFITASDAAAGTLDFYAESFKALHADPAKVFVVGVLGDGEQMPAFLDKFPNRNVRVPIADADWSAAFAFLEQSYRLSLGAPCIEGPLVDVDPAAGLQAECAVWYDFPIGGHTIPSCREIDGECWELVEHRAKCPTESALSFELVRPRRELPDQVMLHVECLSR